MLCCFEVALRGQGRLWDLQPKVCRPHTVARDCGFATLFGHPVAPYGLRRSRNPTRMCWSDHSDSGTSEQPVLPEPCSGHSCASLRVMAALRGSCRLAGFPSERSEREPQPKRQPTRTPSDQCDQVTKYTGRERVVRRTSSNLSLPTLPWVATPPKAR